MTEQVSRIQILAPARLAEFIKHETEADRRAQLAEGLLRLIELHTSYIQNPPAGTHRVGTISPRHRSFDMIEWCIQQNPDQFGFRGQHVLNGGLVFNDATNTWGIHT